MVRINKVKTPKARRILIYGENGVGKSTLASKFPDPLFINLENGVSDIDCDATDLIRGLDELLGLLIQLHDSTYRSIIIDTADWLEKIIFDAVARKAGKETIEEIGFGKGYQAVEKVWLSVVNSLTSLWNQNRHIIFTCHSEILKFDNPEGDSFNYYRPALHPKGGKCLAEWCSEVLYLKHREFTREIKEGFNSKRNIAVGAGERVIVCNEQPAIEAKNRLGMPDELPLAIESFYPYIPKVDLIVGNIAGIVVDGSSKPKPQEEVIESPF